MPGVTQSVLSWLLSMWVFQWFFRVFPKRHRWGKSVSPWTTSLHLPRSTCKAQGAAPGDAHVAALHLTDRARRGPEKAAIHPLTKKGSGFDNMFFWWKFRMWFQDTWSTSNPTPNKFRKSGNFLRQPAGQHHLFPAQKWWLRCAPRRRCPALWEEPATAVSLRNGCRVSRVPAGGVMPVAIPLGRITLGPLGYINWGKSTAAWSRSQPAKNVWGKWIAEQLPCCHPLSNGVCRWSSAAAKAAGHVHLQAPRWLRNDLCSHYVSGSLLHLEQARKRAKNTKHVWKSLIGVENPCILVSILILTLHQQLIKPFNFKSASILKAGSDRIPMPEHTLPEAVRSIAPPAAPRPVETPPAPTQTHNDIRRRMNGPT